jgi:hypothetical protein
MGPNVKQLVIRKMTLSMIPRDGGFSDGLRALLDGKLPQVVKESHEWVKEAIQLVKDAPDSTYTDDEEIAGEILKRMNK